VIATYRMWAATYTAHATALASARIFAYSIALCVLFVAPVASTGRYTRHALALFSRAVRADFAMVPPPPADRPAPGPGGGRIELPGPPSAPPLVAAVRAIVLPSETPNRPLMIPPSSVQAAGSCTCPSAIASMAPIVAMSTIAEDHDCGAPSIVGIDRYDSRWPWSVARAIRSASASDGAAAWARASPQRSPRSLAEGPSSHSSTGGVS